MYYHASPVKNIEILKPQVSNHKIPLIYFSTKRENVLVYLSNAVEKYCKETGFEHSRPWSKWGPYGFDKNGKQLIEEYYPNMLIDTYKNVSGCIYSTNHIVRITSNIEIPYLEVSEVPTAVKDCEYILDAYSEIITAEQTGLLSVIRYDEFIYKRKDWLIKVINDEYQQAVSQPDYRYFLKNKFPEILCKNQ